MVFLNRHLWRHIWRNGHRERYVPWWLKYYQNNICTQIQFFIFITMVGKFYSFPIRVSGYIKARNKFVFTTLLWSNGNRSKIKIWKSSCNNSGRRVFGCGKLPQRSSNSKILIVIMSIYCQTWNSILLIHF